jgi:hypothetical protein
VSTRVGRLVGEIATGLRQYAVTASASLWALCNMVMVAVNTCRKEIFFPVEVASDWVNNSV